MGMFEIIYIAVIVLIGVAILFFGIKENGITYTATIVGAIAAFIIGGFIIKYLDAYMTAKMGEDEWRTALITIAIVSIAIAIYKTHRLSVVEKTRKMIGGCLEFSRDYGFRSVMVNSVNNEAYGSGYSISEDSFKKIAVPYEQYILDILVSQSISGMKKNIMPRRHYFYLSLLNFLTEHSTDGMFYGNDMRKFDCKVNDWTTRYKLTPFGLDYYKAYLAAATYCADNKLWTYTAIDGIKNIIDSGVVDIASYIP